MIDGKNFFDQPINSNLKTNDNLEIFLQVKEMIIQLVVYWIMFTLKVFIK